jgi:hypothetical protein
MLLMSGLVAILEDDMFFALRDAGWPCGRVYPCDDQVWISDAWAEQVRRYVRDGWVNPAG